MSTRRKNKIGLRLVQVTGHECSEGVCANSAQNCPHLRRAFSLCWSQPLAPGCPGALKRFFSNRFHFKTDAFSLCGGMKVSRMWVHDSSLFPRKAEGPQYNVGPTEPVCNVDSLLPGIRNHSPSSELLKYYKGLTVNPIRNPILLKQNRHPDQSEIRS